MTPIDIINASIALRFLETIARAKSLQEGPQEGYPSIHTFLRFFQRLVYKAARVTLALG